MTWPQVRNTYAYIICKIENCEISWSADWDRFERHIYDKIAPINAKTEKGKKAGGATSPTDVTYFCKNYNKPDGCNKESPHLVRMITGMKQLHHICHGMLCNPPYLRLTLLH